MNHEEILRAMEQRHAVRRYDDRPIPVDARQQLDDEVTRINAASGLSIRLRFDDPGAFSGLLPTYGFFNNVRNYLIVASQPQADLSVACGYWGERVVLLAQHLGLNSCWAGLSYNKRRVRGELQPGEELLLVCALGYGLTQGNPHRSKPIDKLGEVRGGGPMPRWFRSGLEAAALAPTAVNQQRFHFELDGDAVSVSTGRGAYTAIDMGIAKYHFEVGAEGGVWHWA